MCVCQYPRMQCIYSRNKINRDKRKTILSRGCYLMQYRIYYAAHVYIHRVKVVISLSSLANVSIFTNVYQVVVRSVKVCRGHVEGTKYLN